MTSLVAPNPLSADIDWTRVESTLGIRIMQSPLQREVVLPAGVREGEADLLRTVGQELDRCSEFGDGRVRVSLEFDGSAHGLLAVLDALKDEVAAGREFHLSSKASVVGAPEGSDVAGSPSPDPATSSDGGAR